MITIKKFGTTQDGREVLAFTLADGGMSATVLNLGGIIQSVIVPDEKGNPCDVVLGYTDVAGYEQNGGRLGALIGRFGNRIGKGKLTLDGREYALYCNDRGNHLHGGKSGFDVKIWSHEIAGDELTLRILSPDGEENYPGNLSVAVTYSFQGGALKLHYLARTDRKTAVNLTNHVYFNLNGEGDGSALDNLLWLDSDEITPTDSAMIPLGGYRSVAETPFDFNTPKEIGRDIGADDPDLKRGNGYDHCFVLKNKCGEFVRFGKAWSTKTGIGMACYTDLPAVQFYTGNGLNQRGKTAFYGKRAGFCLETQTIPNSVNVPEYAARGSAILDRGETYEHTTVYEFSV